MYALGHRKVLTEAMLRDLVKKSPRGIRLTLMAEYTRIVPDDVRARKTAVDDAEAADNWAVLHFDPKKKAVATEAEKEARKPKDPILVALVAGSRKLYVVGDWIDGDDDLTMAKVVEIPGQKTVDAEDIQARLPGID